MAISKAAWRAYESLSEPRTRSQWVWLGRSTPLVWQVWLNWVITYPPDFAWGVPFPQDVYPTLELVDHAYLAQHAGGTYDALAWRNPLTIGGHDCDLVLLQWQEELQLRSCFMLCHGTHALVWLGQAPAQQRDGRCSVFSHPSWAQATLFGGSWTCTPGFLASGLAVVAVGPPWRPASAGIDVSGGTAPTSLVLTFL